ncbi:MAG: tetratricopeptide repeat protein [Halioglobus sp.]|nr:tetratricopeptide repeat protein [Halioglobus sp.]
MTNFYLVCAGLVLLSSVFFLFPRVPPRAEEGDMANENLQWFRLRQRELAQEGADALEEDARLRLLEDSIEPSAVAAAPVVRGFPTWTLLPVVAVMAAILYYALGGARDVIITRQLDTLSDQTSDAEMGQLISALQTRAAQRPDNLHYTALLGRYYMGQGDYTRALEAYETLATAVPEDAQALAYAAQAEYLAAGRQLTDSARLRAEQALAADPQQRSALGLLGMASFEQGQYRAAISYWERLLALEPPGSEGAQMISGVLQRAREALGEPPAPVSGEQSTEVASTADPESTAGVSVRVSLPQGAQVAADETVFVLARNAQSDSRMPIAVQRLRAGQLPFTLRLDDRNSMAGQTLSSVAAVEVVAQVSPDGRPGEANATWVGRVGPLVPGADSTAVPLLLAPNTP